MHCSSLSEEVRADRTCPVALDCRGRIEMAAINRAVNKVVIVGGVWFLAHFTPTHVTYVNMCQRIYRDLSSREADTENVLTPHYAPHTPAALQREYVIQEMWPCSMWARVTFRHTVWF